MKKISFALLASLFVAGAASAQTEQGIVMTHDANVASQIEQHARSVQAQPAGFEQDAQPAREPVMHTTSAHKGAHHHNHRHHKKHAVKHHTA